MNLISTRSFLTLLLVGVLGVFGHVSAQQVFYNSASVYIQTGTNVYVQGGVTNAGTGLIYNAGNVTVTGDWINNASNNAFQSGGNGKVILAGNAQNIGGSSVTNFEVLKLQNATPKTATVNVVVEDSLDLASTELNVGANTISVLNPGILAINSVMGFVSNSVGGGLQRVGNQTILPYVFPVGSSVGTPRIRPVALVFNSGGSTSFKVGFLNNSPTVDGYSTTNVTSPICYVNTKWYHTIARTNGSSNANVSIFFDNVLDSAFTNIGNYSSSWTDLGAAILTSNVSPQLSFLTRNGVSNFANTPFALATTSPVVAITAQGPTTFCQGGSVTLQSQQVLTSYQWYESGNALLGQTNPTLTVTQSGNYTLNAINGICTVTSNAIAVTVNPLPNASFTNPGGTVCVSTAPYNLLPTTPGGTFSGTGITNPANGTFDPSVAGAGTWNITYSITDGNNCSASTSQNIVVNPNPSVTFSGPTTFCANSPATNLGVSPGGGTWSGTGITSPSLGTFDPSVSGVGTFTVNYSVTQVGCTASGSQSITVNALPVAAFTAPSTMCTANNPATLTPQVGGGTFSGPGVTGNTFNPATAGVGTHTVTYTITQGGCTNTSTQQITVTTTPTITFSGPTTFCLNAPATNLGVSPGGGTWSGTGITNPANGTFDPLAAGVGSHTITYSVTQGGCPGSSTQTITVTTNPTVTFSGPTSFCANGPATNLGASPAGGTWSGTGITNPSLGTFNPATAGVGTHTVTYTVTQSGCSGTASQTVTVNPLPNASFTAPATICLSANPATLTPVVSGGSFTGNGVTGNIFDPLAAGTGTHVVTYTLTQLGCTSTSTQSVQVVPNPIVTITSVNPVCSNSSAFNLSASPAGGTWSGTGITNTTTGTFDPSVSGTGTFTVSYTVTQSGCTGSNTSNVVVNALPDASFTAPGALCNNSGIVTLTPTTSGGTFTGVGVTSPNGTFNPSLVTDSTQVTYTVTVGGCTSTTTQTVVIDVPPSIISATGSAPSGTCNYTFTQNSSNASTYLWNFGDGNTSNQQNPTHTYASGGPFTVQAIVSNACGADTFSFSLQCAWLGNEEPGAHGLNVTVYPNPFLENTNVEITLESSDVVDITVYDMLGKVVHMKSGMELSAGTTLVPLEQVFINRSDATYFVHVRFSNGYTSIHKLIRM